MASSMMDIADETADRNDDLQEVADAMAEIGSMAGGGDDDSSESALLAELDELYHDVELGQLPEIPQDVVTPPPSAPLDIAVSKPAAAPAQLEPEPEPELEPETEIAETTPMLA